MTTTLAILAHDARLRGELLGILSQRELRIIEFTDKTDLLAALPCSNIQLVIIGSTQPHIREELGLVEQLRRLDTKPPLILIVAHSTEELAIAALRAGFNDYFKQPVDEEDLQTSIRHLLGERLPPAAPSPSAINGKRLLDHPTMIAVSAPMQKVKARLLQAASLESNVLLTGETGTGKELAAEFIHSNSIRARRPLVSINCAAIPDSLLESELFGHEKGAFTGAATVKKGQFELAHEGTLFLDEIGDMNLSAQAKILRAIEKKEVQHIGGKAAIPLNLRIIAATNQDLERLVEEKKFREDLYFRLNVMRVYLPPLRERKEDIVTLLDHCQKELSRRLGRPVAGFSAEVMECLLKYHWPGNIRELKNLVEASVVHLPVREIPLEDLPEHFQRRLGYTAALPPTERERLLAVLFAVHWNKSKAAKQLSWSRMTLYRKLAKYQLYPHEPPPGQS